MYIEAKKVDNKECALVYFNSMTETLKYIDDVKNDFDDFELKKFEKYCNKYTNNFNITKNYGEAVNLAKTGWNDGTNKINDLLSRKYNIKNDSVKIKSEYSVVGFQCSVPRYLQGIPTNMISSKRVPTKQKTMTIVKHIGFLADVKPQTIIENSVKALAIIQKIESQGIRCNLDIISPAVTFKNKIVSIRVRIKNATEKLNIGIVAFALAHPDMLRRIIFAARLALAYDSNVSQVNSNDFLFHMGSSVYDREIITNEILKPNEKYLHNFIDNVEDEVEKFNKG